jgi:hypothetical protein
MRSVGDFIPPFFISNNKTVETKKLAEQQLLYCRNYAVRNREKKVSERGFVHRVLSTAGYPKKS